MDTKKEEFLNKLYDRLKRAYNTWVTPEEVDDSEEMMEEYYLFIEHWFEELSELLGREIEVEDEEDE
jgi:hypothetical protein